MTKQHIPVLRLGLVLPQFFWLLPLFSWRPNRVAQPELFSVFEAAAWMVPVAAIFSLVTLLMLVRLQRLPMRVLAFFARIQLLYVLALLFFGGSTVVHAAAGGGRIMPASGWWLLLAGVCIQLHSLKLRLAWRSEVGLALTGVLIMLFGDARLLAVVQEYSIRSGRFHQEILAHIGLALGAVAAACMIGIPLGIRAHRSPRAHGAILAAAGGIQTIPSLALFGLLIAPLALLSQTFPALRTIGLRGIGAAPAFIAIMLYSLLPVVRNTYTSLQELPHPVLQAGIGMGMTRSQLFRMVELPLSLPIVLTGVRTAVVQAIGNTAVAALIGAGGLGTFVFQGLGQGADDLILLGVIPIIVLAVAADRLFGMLVHRLDPQRHIAVEGKSE